MRLALIPLFAAVATAAPPIRLLPTNPRYYEFRGRQTILLTSAEHYGAVLNSEFDFVRYLDTLRADGLNLTRAFSGVYREIPGDFGIPDNTLAPQPRFYLSPYARSSTPGSKDGLPKFDLRRWDPAYWARLKRFLTAAAERGIVVEYTLFCVYYQDRMWDMAPWNPINNVNGTPAVPRQEVLSLKHPELVALQEEFLRKVAAELKDFDNLIYEICNEPYVTGVAEDWQHRMARALHDAESAFPARHLIGQNIANNTKKVDDPDPNVSFLNFHYARPPVAVTQNYGLRRVIGLDETGFDGTLDAIYRFQAWDFLHAGGGHYNNLDYSFTVAHPDGSYLVPGTAPGGGSATLRKQLKILRDYFAEIPFASMSPAPGLVVGGLPEGFSARALAEGDQTFAIYVHSGRLLPDHRPRYVYRTSRQEPTLALNLPSGTWIVEFWDTRTGRNAHTERFQHPGGHGWVAMPAFTEDAAMVLRRR